MPEGSCSEHGDLSLKTHFHEAGSERCQCGEVATQWPLCNVGEGAGWTWSMPADPVPVDRKFTGAVSCTEVTRAAPPKCGDEVRCLRCGHPPCPACRTWCDNMDRNHETTLCCGGRCLYPGEDEQ